MQTLIQLVLVAVGSAIGGVTRWAVSVWIDRRTGIVFPWATLFINVSGSLFLGWFITVISRPLTGPDDWWLRPADLRLLVGVGFTGAYTTFSTFEIETYSLLRDDRWLIGAAYVAVSVFVGLLAVRAGVWLGGR